MNMIILLMQFLEGNGDKFKNIVGNKVPLIEKI